jgi:hypothetical protein
MKNLLLRAECNVVCINNGGMKTVQTTKTWNSSNERYAKACKIAHLLFIKNILLKTKYLIFITLSTWGHAVA